MERIFYWRFEEPPGLVSDAEYEAKLQGIE
jgi:hypothetical protein